MKFYVLIAATVIGALLSPTLLSGDASRMFITFLGLVSASILPSVSLVIGSMTSSGRSVMKINELSQELTNAIQVLFYIFSLVAVVIVLLLLMSIMPNLTWKVAHFEVEDLGRRCLQAVAALFTAKALIETLAIPSILMRVLELKTDIAIFEARKILSDNKPSDQQVKEMFPKKEGFGKVISVEQTHQ